MLVVAPEKTWKEESVEEDQTHICDGFSATGVADGEEVADRF